MNPDKLIRFGFNPLSYWETLYRKRVLVGRFILFAFLLLLGRHLFQPYLFRSDDLEFHGARVANYYLALKQGQFPPRWAPNLNYGFGYPTFNFAYPLPYAIAAFFYAAGLGVEASLNVVLLLALITAGLGAMTLVWSITRNWFLSLVLGLWYVVAPYQLMNLFVRGALGEYLFLAQLPWLLWLLKMTVHKNNRWAKVGLAVTLTTSLLSHAVSLGFYIPVLGAWWLLLVKDKGIQALREGIEAVSMAALLSAFYWMPLVLELPFVETAGNEALEGFWQRFLSLRELIWSNWSYGGFVEETAGSMFTLTVGAAGWLFVIASLATLLKRRIRSLGGWVFLVIFGMAVFVTSQPSADLWRLVPVLAILQFPWRLLGVTVIASMMTLALSYRTSNPLPLLSKLLVGLAVVFIGYDFTFHAHPIGQFENPDIEWREYPGTGSSYDEFKSAGFDRHRNLALTEDLIFKADLKESTWQGASELPLAKEVWHGSRKRFKVNLNEPAYAIFKTMYFPGWQAWVDGREVEIIADDSLLPGRVIVPLLGGEQTVELMVGEHTQARQAGDGLTILGLVWVVGSLSWEIKKKVRVDEAD